METAKAKVPGLLEACRSGHVESVQSLLATGANIALSDANGDTPLHAASENGHATVVELLLRVGSPIDQSNANGWTALMQAASSGYAAVAQMLLKHGAKVDKASSNGRTALHFASENGYLDVVRVLIGSGASINVQDVGESSALMLACSNGSGDVVELLLESRAAVDLVDRFRWTALMRASKEGHTEVVSALLRRGARIDKQSSSGGTALSIATANGYLETARALIDQGAAIDVQDIFGRSALIRACFLGNASVAEFLLDHGASVDLVDEDGLTALTIASEQGYTDVVRVLLRNAGRIDKRLSSTALQPEALKLHPPARTNIIRVTLSGRPTCLPSTLHPSPRSPLSIRAKHQNSRVQRQTQLSRSQPESSSSSSSSGDSVVFGLIAANVLVTTGWLKAESSRSSQGKKLLLRHFTTSRVHLQLGLYHTLLTAAFSQASLGHLGANMLGLYFFGRQVAHVLGPRRFLGLYVASGVLSTTAAVLEQHLNHRVAINLGASGAVNAVTAMGVLLFPHGTLLLFGVVPMPAWLGGSMFIFKDAYAFATDKKDGIGHVAHLSGALVGGLYFYFLRRRGIRNFPFGRF
ncbi:putative serine protease family S54 [Phytophthora cinnamomi]|uniref:putative serine protease family S54 n=1 Tax=Phytophthora cinnamomi TaxID=4785 RepID=UPI00355A852C|nr:putative serine protease family S54 [Phytophthora cinnamomi]